MSSTAQLWSRLNGVVCVYKPRGASLGEVKRSLRERLCGELNALHNAEVVGRSEPVAYSEHPLVVGPEYRYEDLRVECLHFTEPMSSGVTLLGLNRGCGAELSALRRAKLLSAYQVVGRLGRATDDRTVHGKVLQRATVDHVSRLKLRKLLAKASALSTAAAIQASGHHPESEAAFELASRGPVRPKDSSAALFYALKLLQLRKPYFSVEVTAASEAEWELLDLVQRLGVSLRCFAATAKLRRLRHGPVGLRDALLEKEWTVEGVLENMRRVGEATKAPRLLSSANPLRLEEGPAAKEPQRFLRAAGSS